MLNLIISLVHDQMTWIKQSNSNTIELDLFEEICAALLS